MPAGQQLTAALFGVGIGVVTIVAIWLVVSNAWYRTTHGEQPDVDLKPTPIGIVEEYPENLAEAHGRPTLFLQLLIVGYALWAIGYVVLFYSRGLK